MKRLLLAFKAFIIILCASVLISQVAVAAARKKDSARPRMIEVEEASWAKLNRDLLNLQDELLKAKTEAATLQAELKMAKKQLHPAAKIKKQAYRVQKNDSLWKIALKFYNDPYKWRWIYKENIKQIDNPNLIYPEQILDIPQY